MTFAKENSGEINAPLHSERDPATAPLAAPLPDSFQQFRHPDVDFGETSDEMKVPEAGSSEREGYGEDPGLRDDSGLAGMRLDNQQSDYSMPDVDFGETKGVPLGFWGGLALLSHLIPLYPTLSYFYPT